MLMIAGLVCYSAGSGRVLAQRNSFCLELAAFREAGTARATDYLRTGQHYASRSDFQCALAAFSEALRLEPESFEAKYGLGRLCWQRTIYGRRLLT
jgi:hypothetical protein